MFNLSVVNGVASGTIKLPPGPARTIHVTAVDDQGNVTHDGTTTIDVRPGQNPPVNIKLAPRSGQVPITVTFGNFGVVVTPATATIDMSAAKQLQLNVTVTDVNGQPTNAQVVWATTQPAVATVDASGLVTGQINGSATIVATAEGVAGLSLITVAGGPSAEVCDGKDNDQNGLVDDGLRYCSGGVAAPHTDGNACLAGFADVNGDPADGCEVSLAGFAGDWSLTPSLTTTCLGLLLLSHPTISQVTTSLPAAGQFLVQFKLDGIPVEWSLQVPIDVATGTFGGTGLTTGQFTADGSITGTFTGPNAFTATVGLKNIAVNLSGASGTCADVNQTVTGTRL